MLSLLLLAKDADRFYIILIRHQQAAIAYIQPPVFSKQWKRTAGIVSKTGFIFVFLFYRGYHYGRLYAAGKTFKLPLDNGVQHFIGFYNVSEFRLNNRLSSCAPDDTVCWQNVIFEKFNTISIRVAKQFQLNTQNKIRTTEYYGNVGRLFYGYEADTVKHVITLKNRSDTTEKIVLNYTVPFPGRFIIKGVDRKNDSIYVVLNKIDKQYPLAAKRTTGDNE